MICLDNTDVIEGGASVTSVVDYTIHGLVGTTFTQLAAGTLSDTLTAALYTAGAAVSVVNITLVNTHSAAVEITLRLDPADGGNPRYIIPETVTLGPGYSLHTDGTRINIMSASGVLVTGSPITMATDPIWTAAGELVIGTGANTAHKLAAGALTKILVGGGAADPVWTEATGSGAPVRGTSPTLVTPIIIATTSVADEAEITLDTGKIGWGTAMAGDNEELIKFRFTAAGVVTIISNTANAINTDTDGFLCVYDAGTGIAIKNRLGATKNIRYIINYS